MENVEKVDCATEKALVRQNGYRVQKEKNNRNLIQKFKNFQTIREEKKSKMIHICFKNSKIFSVEIRGLGWSEMLKKSLTAAKFMQVLKCARKNLKMSKDSIKFMNVLHISNVKNFEKMLQKNSGKIEFILF